MATTAHRGYPKEPVGDKRIEKNCGSHTTAACIAAADKLHLYEDIVTCPYEKGLECRLVVGH